VELPFRTAGSGQNPAVLSLKRALVLPQLVIFAATVLSRRNSSIILFNKNGKMSVHFFSFWVVFIF
jgi:hypothetical protein